MQKYTMAEIVQGDSIRPYTFELKDSEGDPSDLTGCDISCKLISEANPEKSINYATTDGDYEITIDDNIVTFPDVPASDTADLPAGRYSGFFKIIQGDSTESKFQIILNVIAA